MPLATELLPLLAERIQLGEMRGWLDGMHQRLAWLAGPDQQTGTFKLNIEQVFHYAHFDAEVHRLRQHLASVGRQDGPGTAWNEAESISAWLSYLENALHAVVLERDGRADLTPIDRWAERTRAGDLVVTFNYDTLVERALSEVGKTWNHGFARGERGVMVCKLHGSIDWIVAHRSESLSEHDLLFDKDNANRSGRSTGHVEDDCRLWRRRTREQLQAWVSGPDVQSIPAGALPLTVGIAGLGAYKQLHQIPGLGRVWTLAMRTLLEADHAVIAGFSMSEFDAMAQMQFAEIARKRHDEGRPLKVTVIDPFADETTKRRFQRVFRSVDFVDRPHEEIDWTCY
jgi:hypothetical protein